MAQRKRSCWLADQVDAAAGDRTGSVELRPYTARSANHGILETSVLSFVKPVGLEFCLFGFLKPVSE